MLDNTASVWELEQANKISQTFATSLDVMEIARLATDGLVEKFRSAFARIWLVEPDREMLKLVASSGLYTRTDGEFSRIPMGAFKVGRIAQNRVSLLSNNLAEESWVKDPQWALDNNIKGFAGYPLVSKEGVIGVLAVFSHQAMSPEFLKILSSFCTTLTVALELAALYQKKLQTSDIKAPQSIIDNPSLSDGLARILGQATVVVLGTEQRLALSQTQLFLRLAEILNDLDCTYCRLTYGPDAVALETIASAPTLDEGRQAWEQSTFGRLSLIASYFDGLLTISADQNVGATKIALTFPLQPRELRVRVQCGSPLVQMGLTQMAYAAGLNVCMSKDQQVPLLTDQVDLVEVSDSVIWVNHEAAMTPSGVKAEINLSITTEQLREAVEAVSQDATWGLNEPQLCQQLSNRELEVIALLVQGLRDRDIAEKLFISNSTVKFHINNIMTKLEAKTRMQALYNLMQTNGTQF
ncbi:LuxR C-terminal-related transcriptional regulator [Acaryochloris marina]|uniref:LuxR C-terminal-related transcriptional regulator n=1 Tax=Acaryochloris marina TaxID=155978 RepID=UPI0021C30F21|nr:LuxR C-terminal-related transcriptional regulator [Acaryochloris marina]BDM83371.1 hypothetical protein AM10699_62320 [Acaryochloris marina MBIC10699]